MTATTKTVTVDELLADPALQLSLVGQPIHLTIEDATEDDVLTVSSVVLGFARVDNGIAFRFQGLENEPLSFTREDLDEDGSTFSITYLDYSL